MEADEKPKTLDVNDIGSLGITMREGERILIAGMIEVVLSRIEGSRVGIVVRAPKAIEVVRGSLLKSR